MTYDKELGILESIEKCGDSGFSVGLHHDPTKLFDKYRLTVDDGLIAETDDPAEALWEWMKRN